MVPEPLIPVKLVNTDEIKQILVKLLNTGEKHENSMNTEPVNTGKL